MKLRTVLVLALCVVGIGFISTAQRGKHKGGGDEQTEEVNKIAEYRAKSRENLKPHRYDGTKVIYFNYNYYEQKKEIEVLMFNGIDYKFAMNTDGCPKGIDIRIYDKPDTSKERILLWEQAGVAQRDITILSKDLLAKLQETKSSITSLKRVYIDYFIPVTDKKVEAKPLTSEEEEEDEESTSAPKEKGVVVLSYGYKST